MQHKDWLPGAPCQLGSTMVLRVQVLAMVKVERDSAHCAWWFSNGGKVGHTFWGVSIHKTSSEDNSLINL